MFETKLVAGNETQVWCLIQFITSCTVCKSLSRKRCYAYIYVLNVKERSCVISGYRGGVNEAFVSLGFYAELIDSQLWAFRNSLSVPSWTFKQSGNNYQSTVHNVPKEGRPQERFFEHTHVQDRRMSSLVCLCGFQTYHFISAPFCNVNSKHVLRFQSHMCVNKYTDSVRTSQ